MTDFGTDLSLVDDLEPTMREVSGTELLGQALFRRLTTPRGMLLDDPDYGTDVREFVSWGALPTKFAAIPALVRAELLKDERIEAATVSTAVAGGSVRLNISIDTGDGPFPLVVDVTQAGAVLLGSTT